MQHLTSFQRFRKVRWVSRCSSSTQAKLKFCGSTLTFEIWVFRPWCPLWQTFFSTFFRRKIKTLLSKEREHQGCGAWQWRGPRWRGRFRLWQAPNSNCDLATIKPTFAENHFQTFPKEERHGKTWNNCILSDWFSVSHLQICKVKCLECTLVYVLNGEVLDETLEQQLAAVLSVPTLPKLRCCFYRGFQKRRPSMTTTTSHASWDLSLRRLGM